MGGTTMKLLKFLALGIIISFSSVNSMDNTVTSTSSYNVHKDDIGHLWVYHSYKTGSIFREILVTGYRGNCKNEFCLKQFDSTTKKWYPITTVSAKEEAENLYRYVTNWCSHPNNTNVTARRNGEILASQIADVATEVAGKICAEAQQIGAKHEADYNANNKTTDHAEFIAQLRDPKLTTKQDAEELAALAAKYQD